METNQESISINQRTTILLINPHHHKDWNYQTSQFSFPIGLMYLSAHLKNAGYRPVIIDTCTDPHHESRIKEMLPLTLFAGISAMTPQVPHAYHLAKMIRNHQPEMPIVWGGIHPSLYPDSCLDSLCTAAVIGEGDRTCVDLANVFRTRTSLDGVPGIAYNMNGRVVHTAARPLLDVDRLPPIDYTGIPFEKYIGAYLYQEKRTARVVPVHAARGCPWHCTFCINTTLNSERRYRPRSASVMLDEITQIQENFQIEGIMLQDEEFFASRERVLQLLDGIESRHLSHLKFFATSRVNHFREGYIDAAFLKRLKRCGFVDLVFGVESGSRHCLEIIRKEITVDQALHAANLLAAEQMNAAWGFIMAIPGETRKDIVRTLQVMEKIRRMSPVNYFIGPQIFRPYPGSVLYRAALNAGLTEPGSLKEWAEQPFNAEGWTGSASLPWIDPNDKDFIEYINFVSPVYFNQNFMQPQGMKKLFHWFLRALFRLRLSLNFWNFPAELKIRKTLRNSLGPKG